ncbi:MAG: RDD family protein [Candidatus Hodarchaeota archaeon]
MMKFCPSCGSQNDPDSMFCVICGEVLSKNSTPVAESATRPAYVQPGSVPDQEYSAGPSFILATWPARFAAWLLDIIIVGVVIGILGGGISLFFYLFPLRLTMPFGILAAFLLIFLVLGYGPLMEYYYGATLGKMILKLKVVNIKTGEKPELMQSIISNLGKMFLLVIDVLLGLLVEECAKMNQRIFQRAVDLVVIQDGATNPGYA